MHYTFQPILIPYLEAIVEHFVECIDPDIIGNVCASVKTRFQMIRSENGERLLQSKTAQKPFSDQNIYFLP